ncbi:MAG TPA: alpha/beta fold hydrolase [Rhizomicrobium sp.]
MIAAVLSPTAERQVSADPAELLLGIWRRLLQTEDVTAESDFFDLGGDSLLALTLFLEIERATGRHLPITAIYDARTVAAQAKLLKDEHLPEFSPLVLLKPGDGGPPLFIFHGIGGTVVEFAELGRLIEIGGPVYAVQAQGVDGTLPPLQSVEEMADLYDRTIREKQPRGPYWLCGYSFGGVIAVEVARRLRNAGEEIGLLFLIDAYAHPVTWPRITLLRVQLRKAANRLLSSLRSPPSAAAVIRLLKAALTPARNTVSADKRAAKRTWLLNKRPDLPLPLLQTRLASDVALSQYRPAYYPGEVVFLKARYPDPDFPRDPKRVWRSLVGGLKVHVSSGSHMTIVSEHAPGVADRINESIRETKTLKPAKHPLLATGAVPAFEAAGGR